MHFNIHFFFLLCVFATSCTQDSISAPIVIGGIFDLSSSEGARWGKDERDGFLLAFKNRPDIPLFVEDGGYSPKKAVSAFRKLVSIHKSNIVIGPTWENFFVTQPMCAQSNLLCISLSSNLGRFDDKSKRHSLTMWLDERDYARAIAEKIRNENLKRISVVSAQSPYHELLTEQLQFQLEEKISSIKILPTTTNSFRDTIMSLPPDLDGIIILLPQSGGVSQFVRQWNELRNSRPNFFTDDYILYDRTAHSSIRKQIQYVAPHFDLSRQNQFLIEFEKAYGRIPASPAAAIGFDAGSLILACIGATGKISVWDTEKCIRDTKKHEGISGTIDFNGKRAANRTPNPVQKVINYEF